MKDLSRILLTSAFCLVSFAAMARNDRSVQSIGDGMHSAQAASLDNDVRLYFGNKRHPGAHRTIGEWTTHRKGSAGRDAAETSAGCHYAFISALLQLQQRAAREGGNAVINITSRHGKTAMNSSAQYLCGVGRVKTAVVLTGTVVRIGR